MKRKILNGVEISMDSNVNEIYCEMYPNDEFGKELRGDISLNDVWKCLLDGKNVYDLLDIGDSEVRVRVFEMISVLKECDYLEIWDLWLTKGEQPLWIPYTEMDMSTGCIIPKLDLHDIG